MVFALTGCQEALGKGQLKGTGLLIEDTINDQGWGTKGYKGLLQVKDQFETEVFYREEIKSKEQVLEAVHQFKKDGVNLVFGHGQIYAPIFQEIKADFPNLHFVSFNGIVSGDGITSVHFDSYAMGYFAGVLAGAMSESGQVGMIAAFPWQPEVTGFQEGVNVYNPNAVASVQFVNSWSNTEKAIDILRKMEKMGVDVYYPAGDGYTIPVIKEVKDQGDYAIGFVSNMTDLGKQTVLTSTVQHVDLLYVKIAKQFDNGELKSGNRHYDFQDGVISLAPFSDEVPKKLQKKLNKAVSVYKETGKLPAP